MLFRSKPIETIWTITLNANGGKVSPSSIKTDENGMLSADKLPVPTRDGYDFAGWYTLAEGGKEVTEETEFGKNTTIYAHWTKKNTETPPEEETIWTITLNANGGKVSPSSIRTDKDGKLPIDEFPVPVRDGYSFDGWYSAPEGGSEVSADRVFDSSRTIYAHWTKKAIDTPPEEETTWIVIFDANEGKVSPSSIKTDKDGVLAGKLPVPTRDGYDFAGWYTLAEGGEKVTEETRFNKNTTIYAHWTKKNSGSSGSSSGSSSSRRHSYSSSSSDRQGEKVSVPQGYTGETKLIRNVRVPSYTVEGQWAKTADGKWKLSGADGKAYAGAWVPVYNPYADLNAGVCAFGWYIFDQEGNMVTGWYTDALGDTYYLNPISDNTQGEMLIGWQMIDGKYYYFNTNPDGTRGKMLKNVVTPDGYYIDENGVWDGKEKS